MHRLALLILVATLAGTASAETLVLAPERVPEWKAVYGRVEARDTVPARARIGGVLVELLVSEGDDVIAGQRIAVVEDDKIGFQVSALEAQLEALRAQLGNAEAELARGEALVSQGVATAQRLDALRTQADVVRNQIAATEAQRQVLVEQASEGEVLAPLSGRVLSVPVTRDAVIMAGEPVATIGGGGFFLRLAIPERHGALLEEDTDLNIEAGSASVEGRLAKVYPQVENGRVIADVEVADLPTDFVDARLLVRVPVGEREALMVPSAAVHTRWGLDLVRVEGPEGEVERTVVVGERDGDRVEIVTGLSAGDKVVTP